MTGPERVVYLEDRLAELAAERKSDVLYQIEDDGWFVVSVEVRRAGGHRILCRRETGYAWRDLDTAARRALRKLQRQEDRWEHILTEELRLTRQGPALS